VTEYLGDVSLALPFSGVMTEEQVDYVSAAKRRSQTLATALIDSMTLSPRARSVVSF
jgi:hypothetical protein